MRYGNRIAALGCATWALTLASPALAATAHANFGCCSEPSVTFSAPGFATAEKSSSRGFAQGNAYEFDGGVGVSAFAATNIGPNIYGALAQATGEAAISKTIRIGTSANPLYHLYDMGDDVIFEIAFTVNPSGTLSVSNQPYSPTVSSAAFASYNYDWNFGGVTGGGSAYQQYVYSPTLQQGETHGPNGGLLLVRLGDVVSFTMHARASATAWPIGNRASSNAAADFSHTLRWGGVTGITARDSMGNAIALPTGFNLSLTPDGGGMDYFNAAGPNPFTAVPEPAEWALLLTGFGLVGGTLRRRTPRLAAN